MLGWCLSLWHPTQQGWCTEHRFRPQPYVFFRHGPVLSPTGLPTPRNWSRSIRSFLPYWRTTLLRQCHHVSLSHTFCNYSGEEGITRLIVPSWGYRICLEFYYADCCAKPITHWQVLFKFSVLGKNSPLCKTFRNSRNHTSPFPSQGAFLPTDVLAKYVHSVFKLLWILAIQAKVCQYHSDMRRWADIFVVNVIEERQRRLFDHKAPPMVFIICCATFKPKPTLFRQ